MAKEVNVNEVLQFVGVSKLSIEDQDIVQRLSTEYYEKIKRAIKNITSITVHCKCHDKEGNRKKYSFHIHCVCPSKSFESNKHHDFELSKACHKAFKALLKEVQHNFKSDVSRQRSFR